MVSQRLQQALTSFQRGDLDAAAEIVAAERGPDALHLKGLIAQRLGDLDGARRLLEQAARAAPGNPEIAHNRGLLARQAGDADAAEALYRRALQLQPGFVGASLSLGRLLVDALRWKEARRVYAGALKTSPDSVGVRYGLGMAELGMGLAEPARARFDALLRQGADRPAIRFMRARCNIELGEHPAALADLRAAHAGEPTVLTLRTLAGQYWMLGEEPAFRELVAAASANPGLLPVCVELLREASAPEAAAALVDPASTDPEAAISAAFALIDLQDPEAAALRLAPHESLIQGAQPHRRGMAARIVVDLMRDRADAALAMVARMRALEPLGQHWIGYQATALQVLDSDAHRRLVDVDRLIRIHELPIPEGCDDLLGFNAALADLLAQEQRYARRPLDQSLRDGVQTQRNLATSPEPLLQAYMMALKAPVARYLEDIGRAGDHPLTARNRGAFAIRDCWSVRLGDGGRHQDHVHPEGWISSAYYVQVPEDDGSDAGSIRFGLPPFPVPGITEPLLRIQPRAGQLVLFPSFMWHGTEAIGAGRVRITAPFDVQPA